jgi:hypothetical protein
MSTETTPLTLAEATATTLIARIEAGETVSDSAMIRARGAIWRANDAAGGPTAHPIADRLSAEIARAYEG